MKKTDNTKCSPMRLLLVDDEDEFRQTIAKRLAKRGLVANQAADGAECLSWLEKKASETAVTEVNLMRLADEAIQLISHEIKKRGIQIVRKIDPSLAPIWSDAYQIRQVLLNLLTNAIHAVNSEGTITIAVKDDGDSQEITVSDTGPGIPRENLAKIFEPFFSTKGPGQGTGLGLFVSRGIIEKLGGTIGVDSKIGHGACFSIRLPKHLNGNVEFEENRGGNWAEKIRPAQQSRQEKDHHD
jgi:signal transduction histidine kinase